MIKGILTKDVVLTDVSVKDWREAVSICGKLLLGTHKIVEQYIDSMIKTIEEFGPYMILLPGIALFHGRPDEGVREICLSLVTFREEVGFKEFGDESIKAAFAFGATDESSHMEILREMALLLQDGAFIDLLKNNGSKEQIMDMITSIDTGGM